MDMIFLPIEPIPHRYSESWHRNFPKAFEAAGFDVKTLNGISLEKDIRVGTFLDINSTVFYKMQQLETLAIAFNLRRVKPGTVFFFADAEFWGLESVRLMAQMNGIPIKMAGFLHAASYTNEDAFSIAAPYQKYTEIGWLACLDKIFVGSYYHKYAIIDRRLNLINTNKVLDDRFDIINKIIPTGNPIFMEDYDRYPVNKEKRMLLTNRFDREKRPGQTLDMFRWLKGNGFHDWEFIVTTSSAELRSNDPTLLKKARDLADKGVITIKEGLTKHQYHEELARASIMVSHSIEENYGYCIAEALLYGVVPIIRKGLSHTEFLGEDSSFLFRDFSDAIEIAQELMPKFGTFEWPALPPPPNGLERIVEELVQLASKEEE